MKKILLSIFTLALSISLTAQMQPADAIVTYNFQNSANRFAPIISAANLGLIEASDITLFKLSSTFPTIDCPSSSIGMETSGWPNSNSIDLTTSIQFTISPLQVQGNAPNQLTITDIEFDALRTKGNGPPAGPNQGSIRSSLDNFASDIALFSFELNCQKISISLSSQFAQLTTPVTFRIYAWNADCQGSPCNLQIDNIWIIGPDVTPGPPLPVQLTSFTGIREAGAVLLNWQTAMEQDNEFFIIERSTNGTEFTSINKVAGAGNSTSILNYKYIDNAPVSGNAYYRLKQVDFDGTFEYSKIITIAGAKQVFSFNLYPNPATADINLNLFTEASSEIILEITDLTGRVIYTTSASVNKGNNNLSLSVADLQSGIYFVKILNGENVKVERFIKQ